MDIAKKEILHQIARQTLTHAAQKENLVVTTPLIASVLNAQAMNWIHKRQSFHLMRLDTHRNSIIDIKKRLDTLEHELTEHGRRNMENTFRIAACAERIEELKDQIARLKDEMEILQADKFTPAGESW